MYRIGIDLGGTNIVAGVVDENYKIVGKGKMKTNMPRPAEAIADDMAKTVFMAIEDAGLTIDDIEVMGIGSPGAIDPINGVITYANNLNFFDVPMAQLMKERVGKDFFIENDAKKAFEKIIEISRNPDKYNKTTQEICNITFKSTKKMSEEYMEIYNKWLEG